jgi:hypothetical protein
MQDSKQGRGERDQYVGPTKLWRVDQKLDCWKGSLVPTCSVLS